MQSGRARTKKWRLEFEPEAARHIDSLMGWCGSGDTKSQVALNFDTLEQAIEFAERRGIDYRVMAEHERRVKPKSYADNFAYKRVR